MLINDELYDKQHYMVDLETVGTKGTPAILSIGAVRFDLLTGVELQEFYVDIDLIDSVKHGFGVDGETFYWWMRQDDAARIQIANSNNKLPIKKALKALSTFMGNYPGYIWSNGAAMDIAILESAYQQMGMEVPWSYKDQLCYRTVMSFAPDFRMSSVGVEHNALDDAIYQVRSLLVALGKKKPEDYEDMD